MLNLRASSYVRAALALTLALISSSNAADASSSFPLDCSKVLTVNGNTYDLSSLKPVTVSSSYSTPPSTTRVEFAMSLCAPLSSSPGADDCPAKSRICQKISATTPASPSTDILLQVIPLSTEDFGYEVSLGDPEGQSGAKNLEWEFKGPTYAGKEQRVKLEMVCDSKATDTKPEWRSYDPLEGKTKVYWKTSVACATSGSETGAVGGDGSSKGPQAAQGGWGFFSWLFFLITVGFIAYFAIGIYQNKQQYGVYELPHRDFWKEVPYLIQDTGKHAWKSLSGGGSSSRGAYEPLG